MLVKLLRLTFLLLSAAWLGLSGVALPVLYQDQAYTAFAHTLIIAGISLFVIVALNKPKKVPSKVR